MDKKILILKNDRVGDFFHSIRNLQLIKNLFVGYEIELCLSEVNIRFSNVIKHLGFNISELKIKLSTKDKIKIVKKFIDNNYEYIFILSPKNFYFYLPLLFKKTKFVGICINGSNRNRPPQYLRDYLFKYEINDRRNNAKKPQIHVLEETLILKTKNKPMIKKYEQKNINRGIKNSKVIFHYKSSIFGDFNSNIHMLINFFKDICEKHNLKIYITTDIEKKIENIDLNLGDTNGKNINFLGPINSSEIIKIITKSELVIGPHGAITCIGAYYNKNIIDIFNRDISKNAFYEFKPKTNGNYQFIVKSNDIGRTINKILLKINNLL